MTDKICCRSATSFRSPPSPRQTEVRSLHETILSPKQRRVWKMCQNRQNGVPFLPFFTWATLLLHRDPPLRADTARQLCAPLYTRASHTQHCSHSRPSCFVLGTVLSIVGCLAASLASHGLPWWLRGNAGDLGSIPGSGRSPGEGNANPLQYFCLENTRDREAW